jgi:hypothetical protein
MPGVFILEAAQPSLKLKQLPPFYAFWVFSNALSGTVAQEIHFSASRHGF